MDELTMRVREAKRKFLWLGWWAFPVAGVAVAMLTVVGMWWALVERRWPVWMVALVQALEFAGTDGAVRIPAAQTAFWLATRARLDSRVAWFMSDRCYIRLEEAAGGTAGNGVVVLSGTNQMTCGIDEMELGRILAPVGVIRREVSGMEPQCMMSAWAGTRKGCGGLWRRRSGEQGSRRGIGGT